MFTKTSSAHSHLGSKPVVVKNVTFLYHDMSKNNRNIIADELYPMKSIFLRLKMKVYVEEIKKSGHIEWNPKSKLQHKFSD